MKLNILPTVLSVVAIASPVHATTILLTDNFNGNNGGNQYVNWGYEADQGGTLGSVGYSVSVPAGWWNAARGNTNSAISGTYTPLPGIYATAYDDGRFSLNRDFAIDANSANQALQISFNAFASNFSNPTGWGTFTVGSAQNIFTWEGGGKYGFTFNQNQVAEVYDATGPWQTEFSGSYSSYGSDLFTILLTDTVGTGSAFNGNGTVAKFYVGGNLLNTATLGQLGVGDGYLTFATLAGYFSGYGQANFDNLTVALVPEPGAALLGGLGMFALLRRRR